MIERFAVLFPQRLGRAYSNQASHKYNDKSVIKADMSGGEKFDIPFY
ncbi:MAG: hypothetical protein V2A66_08475 [Pseudomonadota bacterium]